jgi:hypothetical protein
MCMKISYAQDMFLKKYREENYHLLLFSNI